MILNILRIGLVGSQWKLFYLGESDLHLVILLIFVVIYALLGNLF